MDGDMLMGLTLGSGNFPFASSVQEQELESGLRAILQNDYSDNLYAMLAGYQRILADNHRREHWPIVHDKLHTLFKCGVAAPLNGPMIGIPVGIRDSDFFTGPAGLFGKNRSLLASIEIMATAWNATFADTGLWMGKTFEPVREAVVRSATGDDPAAMAAYDAETSRIGRNFFRDPPDPNALQGLGLPVLERAWKLKQRPMSTDADGFAGELLAENLEKETRIPYSKTGGIYLAAMGVSVVPGMCGKEVYQLNYRWPGLGPVFPMTMLVDEIVQIGDGIYLGQLVYATRHFSLGSIDLPFIPGSGDIELGEPYRPNQPTLLQRIPGLTGADSDTETPDYGYQNNGFFLMMDPAYASQVYADDAFPQLRPRRGESGFTELGYDVESAVTAAKAGTGVSAEEWRGDETLTRKFTTLITETSTRSSDVEAAEMLREGESVLQMLQRFSNDISAQTRFEDHLEHFEALHRLFRGGVAPGIENGLFRGAGAKGYNTRLDGKEVRDWYGEDEVIHGFDYYHGANLNLHWGFSETFCPDRSADVADASLLPGVLGDLLDTDELRGPNLMNTAWHSIGKYIFPWAGKSYETISPRKLSMLLDESADLESRYPQRVRELKNHLASFPHYALVKNNRDRDRDDGGIYAEHLAGGSWDLGMGDADKAFWEGEAEQRWLMGYNLQDQRIVGADALMRIADMNYREPEAGLQRVSETSGSPFARQGYCFLGAADRQTILPMNNGDNGLKRVFQFHYRFPLIGGPAPIGFCLDELVEIADGLFLGQLIYATRLDLPFHSSVDPGEYGYQLFGYFVLLDDDWERHRQAIGLDTID